MRTIICRNAVISILLIACATVLAAGAPNGWLNVTLWNVVCPTDVAGNDTESACITMPAGADAAIRSALRMTAVV